MKSRRALKGSAAFLPSEYKPAKAAVPRVFLTKAGKGGIISLNYTRCAYFERSKKYVLKG